MSGPTTGATEQQDTTWAQHRVLAGAVRVGVAVAPAFITWWVTGAVGPRLYRPPGILGLVAWLIQLAFVGAVVVALTGRVTRRLLPLATLLNVSLAFPDQVPSRFRVALKGGTVRNLQGELDAFRRHDPADVQARAEHLLGLVASLSRHERLTRGHTERVRAYADMIGEEMGLSREDRLLLQWSCLVHDIGKLSVPASVLNKAGRPTDEEWELLRRHPEVGGELVEPLAPWLGEWRLAASQHHERWDGKGYPAGLAGTSISLAGRIVAVADAYDVITSARSYKKPMTAEAARAELVRCSGTQFDPAVVRAFLNVSVRKTSYTLGLSGWVRELLSLGQTGGAAVSTTVGQVALGAVVAGSVAAAGATPEPPPAVEQTAAPVSAEPAAARAGAAPTMSVMIDPATTSTTVVVTTTTTTEPVRAATSASPEQAASEPDPVPPPTTEAPAPTAPPTTAPPTTTTRGPSAPVAVTDTYSVSVTSTTWLEVLENDKDVDGDLRPDTLALLTQPEQGEVTLDATRARFRFRVANATPGPTAFTYQVCDAGGRCATGRVTINIR